MEITFQGRKNLSRESRNKATQVMSWWVRKGLGGLGMGSSSGAEEKGMDSRNFWSKTCCCQIRERKDVPHFSASSLSKGVPHTEKGIKEVEIKNKGVSEHWKCSLGHEVWDDLETHKENTQRRGLSWKCMQCW